MYGGLVVVMTSTLLSGRGRTTEKRIGSSTGPAPTRNRNWVTVPATGTVSRLDQNSESSRHTPGMPTGSPARSLPNVIGGLGGAFAATSRRRRLAHDAAPLSLPVS